MGRSDEYSLYIYMSKINHSASHPEIMVVTE